MSTRMLIKNLILIRVKKTVFPFTVRTGISLVLISIFFCNLVCAPSRNRITSKKNYNRKTQQNTDIERAVEHFSWHDTNEEDITPHYTLNERDRYNRDAPDKKSILYEKEIRSRENENKQGRIRTRPTRYRDEESTHTYIVYRIRKGDTLYRISKRYNIPVEKIVSINRIQDTRNIRIGTKLKIPQKNATTAPQHRRASKKSIHFSWPIQSKIKIRRDGQKGVKSIGIFITGKPGEKVRSSATGVVKKIGRMRGFGNYVVIKHNKRYITVYSNLDSIIVAEGEHIKKGEYIGRIQNSDNELHFQINYSGKPQDPLRLLPKS